MGQHAHRAPSLARTRVNAITGAEPRPTRAPGPGGGAEHELDRLESREGQHAHRAPSLARTRVNAITGAEPRPTRAPGPGGGAEHELDRLESREGPRWP